MNANEIKNSVLAGLAVCGTFIANQLGGWDTALAVLVGFMAADFLTGSILALVFHKSEKTDAGKYSSSAGFKGIVKKGVMLLAVWVACSLDQLSGAPYARNAMILFFIGNEGLSIAENIGLMGVPLPPFLKNALEALKDKNANAGTPNV
jgi:toxin secretion/phage lysis holin